MTDKEKAKLRDYYGQKMVQNYFNHPDHIQIWIWTENPLKIIVFFRRGLNGLDKFVIATKNYVLLENAL